MAREEERSFGPRPVPVGELSPIDIDALTPDQAVRALAKGVMQNHSCLEQHIAATRLAEIIATEKRQELAEDVLGLRTDVVGLKGDVRGLTLALGVQKPLAGEEKPKAHGLASWPAWKLLVAASAIGFSGPALVQLVVKLAPVVGPVVLAWVQSLG